MINCSKLLFLLSIVALWNEGTVKRSELCHVKFTLLSGHRIRAIFLKHCFVDYIVWIWILIWWWADKLLKLVKSLLLKQKKKVMPYVIINKLKNSYLRNWILLRVPRNGERSLYMSSLWSAIKIRTGRIQSQISLFEAFVGNCSLSITKSSKTAIL